MKVIAYDPYAPADRVRALGAELVSLDDALAQGHFFSLHMPLTPTTQNLFNQAAFEKMRKGAYVINVARGGVIEDSALVYALDNKIVAVRMGIFCALAASAPVHAAGCTQTLSVLRCVWRTACGSVRADGHNLHSTGSGSGSREGYALRLQLALRAPVPPFSPWCPDSPVLPPSPLTLCSIRAGRRARRVRGGAPRQGPPARGSPRGDLHAPPGRLHLGGAGGGGG